MIRTLAAVLALCVAGAVAYAEPVMISVHTPADCVQITAPGDHLLITYRAYREDGETIEPAFQKPGQLFHMALEQNDILPMHKYLKGLCANETRILRFENGAGLDLSPTPINPNNLIDLEEKVSIEFTIEHITTPSDYQIFGAWREGNLSLVLDMITEHRGVNAFDEWGQTLLMHAVQRGSIEVVSALLNTRMPKVDVNVAKSNGFSALLYAVDLPSTSLLKALLRRGADPNCQLRIGAGNTPLHLAAIFEKTKHAEMLLEYGANPSILNDEGMNPLQLLPKDAVRSTKLYFKRMFEDAYAKILEAEEQARSGHGRTSITSGQKDL